MQRCAGPPQHTTGGFAASLCTLSMPRHDTTIEHMADSKVYRRTHDGADGAKRERRSGTGEEVETCAPVVVADPLRYAGC